MDGGILHTTRRRPCWSTLLSTLLALGEHGGGRTGRCLSACNTTDDLDTTAGLGEQDYVAIMFLTNAPQARPICKYSKATHLSNGFTEVRKFRDLLCRVTILLLRCTHCQQKSIQARHAGVSQPTVDRKSRTILSQPDSMPKLHIQIQLEARPDSFIIQPMCRTLPNSSWLEIITVQYLAYCPQAHVCRGGKGEMMMPSHSPHPLQIGTM